MEEYPRTLQELEARFATEEAEAWSTRRGLRMCVACGHQVSVTAGTIFQGTRMPLGLWFRAI